MRKECSYYVSNLNIIRQPCSRNALKPISSAEMMLDVWSRSDVPAAVCCSGTTASVSRLHRNVVGNVSRLVPLGSCAEVDAGRLPAKLQLTVLLLAQSPGPGLTEGASV